MCAGPRGTAVGLGVSFTSCVCPRDSQASFRRTAQELLGGQAPAALWDEGTCLCFIPRWGACCPGASGTCFTPGKGQETLVPKLTP